MRRLAGTDGEDGPDAAPHAPRRPLRARARIFSATAVEHGKPAPDLFLHAARTCGFAPPDCVVVEDSPAGVSAARAAGMRTLAHVPPRAAGGALAHELAALGAEVLHDMREVPQRVAVR